MEIFTPFARSLCVNTLQKCEHGLLIIHDQNNTYHFGDLTQDSVTITVQKPRFWRRILLGGNVGLAESYIDQDWSTNNLSGLISFFAKNVSALAGKNHGHPMRTLSHHALHAWRQNTRRGSKNNIMAHYDLGNEFYQLWLDPSMTYSSALYDNDDCLVNGQQRKYARLAQIMDLSSDKHVLEVGCGWGGFAKFAATEIGANVTAVTISPSQYAYAAQKLQEMGLQDKISLKLTDYRDLDGSFDAIASIEMFEAVGERYWPVYFSKLFDRLKPGGRAGLQIITIGDDHFENYRKSVDFIQRHVFPGGMLPSVAALKKEANRSGLTWQGEKGFGIDYARTLSQWRSRFEDKWDEIQKLGFDDKFYRFWTYYLCYCEGGFRAGNIDVHQIALSKN